MHGPGVDSSHDCHNCERETPLTLYVALKIHAVTQKRMLVDAPFNLGMCVSYSHFLQLTSDLGNGICDQFALGRVVYPPKMRSGLYIDCNPSAATAKNSFHSTGISLMQHPFHEFEGNNQGVLIIDQTTSGKALLLSLISALVCYQLLSKPKNSKCPLSIILCNLPIFMLLVKLKK